MRTCRKRVFLVISVFLVVSFISCARKVQEPKASISSTEHRINNNNRPATEGSLRVALDNKAKAVITKQQMYAVYCMPMGSTWGGSNLEPAVIAGIPREAAEYDKYESNGIDVYIRKGMASVDGTLTITTEKAYWLEQLVVKGAVEYPPAKK